MKQESMVKYILRLALTLLAITALVAAALAGVNYITAPIIRAANEAKTQAAIEAVLEGGGSSVDFTDTTGMVTAVYASDKGYAVQVAPGGFNGPIQMMVGVSKDGKILGVSVITQTETAGLGAIAGADNDAGQEFRDQYMGLSGLLAVDKDGGEIQSITGATVTSRAVTKGINAALDCVANMG